MSSSQIAEPWNSFLSDLDRGLSTRLVLHCLGGFAIDLTYGLSRQSAGIALCEVAPITTKTDLLALAGEGSALHNKHSVCLQVVKMASLPYYYEERLTEAFRGAFRQLQLLVLDPYDLALSKLRRNSDVDIEDVKSLGASVPLDLNVLRLRYYEEVRPYLTGPPERGDKAVDLWCDAINESRH
jgi:Nucleotidyltransferase of unknown function (DUF6036)